MLKLRKVEILGFKSFCERTVVTFSGTGTTCIVGPNGSGKTTLFNMLTGLVRPDEGTAIYHGTDITRLPPHKIASLGITRTFQNLRLFNNLSVMENVLIGQHARLREGTLASVLRTPTARREEAHVVGPQ